MFDTVTLELVTVSGAEDLVAGDFGGDDLGDDVTVGEANDKAVFGSIVFVLGLSDETLPGVVVGFALATTLVFDLVAARSGYQRSRSLFSLCTSDWRLEPSRNQSIWSV